MHSRWYTFLIYQNGVNDIRTLAKFLICIDYALGIVKLKSPHTREDFYSYENIFYKRKEKIQNTDW